MSERLPPEEPKRVPGRYVVYIVIVFAIGVAIFATWGMRVMRKLPPEAFQMDNQKSDPAPPKAPAPGSSGR